MINIFRAPMLQRSLLLMLIVQGWAFTQAHTETHVRLGTGLCSEEHEFVHNRNAKIQKACEALLNKNSGKNDAPKIALCFSGGGMRAAILSLGCLKAAQEVGLLDCCTYISALSGSTWSVAGVTTLASELQSTAHFPLRKALDEYSAFLRTNLDLRDVETFITEERAQEFWDYLKKRIFSYNTLTATELYGYFLAMLLMPKLTENRFAVSLSKTHSFVKKGTVPMPLYSAMAEASTALQCSANALVPNNNKEVGNVGYRWAEFSPFEMGIAEDVNAYIPMSGFGNNFYAGAGTGYEKTLSYCCAVFGSAFAVNLKDIFLHLSDALLTKTSAPYVVKVGVRMLLDKAINTLLETYDNSKLTEIGRMRLMAAKVPNYCYGIEGNPLGNYETLALVDCGIAFNNVPLPPLLNPARHVDVIIIYDSSEQVQGAPALMAAELYAREHGLPFPVIDYAEIEKRPISVFAGTDAQTPTIIYMPRFATEVAANKAVNSEWCFSDGSCSTFKFRYTPEEFDTLFNISYRALKKQFPVFKGAIQDKLMHARLT